MSAKPWIPVSDKLPEREGYFAVRFADGSEDQKFYRIRKKDIRGFLSEDEITHWR